jgi:hypothetical protein
MGCLCFACELVIFCFKPIQKLISRNTGTAFFTLLELLTKVFDLCCPQFFVFLEQAQGMTDNLACAAVPSTFDFLLYKVLKMRAYGVAGWHGQTSYYQYLPVGGSSVIIHPVLMPLSQHNETYRTPPFITMFSRANRLQQMIRKIFYCNNPMNEGEFQ